MPWAHLKVLAAALFLIVALHLHERFEIRTIADEATLMEPAVRRRSWQRFRTDGQPPPRYAVVWFEHPAQPSKMLLARVIGTAGDRIAIEHGRAVRDGRPLAEDYAEKRVELEDFEEVLIPDGHVYVLNDARSDPGSAALDSRRLGPLPNALVVGYLADRVAEREAAGDGGDAKGGAKGAGPGGGRR